MGHYYHIGEARIDYDPSALSVELSVASIVGDPDAKAKGVREANWFNSSATFFNHAIQLAGLSELFFGGGWSPSLQEYGNCSETFHRDAPLIRHAAPCASAICEKDLDLIREATASWRARLGPEAVAYDDERAPEGDEALMLLEWLEYWFERSLRTCKVPIFHYG